MVPNFTQLETRKTKPISVKSIWTKDEVPTDNRKTSVCLHVGIFCKPREKFNLKSEDKHP